MIFHFWLWCIEIVYIGHHSICQILKDIVKKVPENTRVDEAMITFAGMKYIMLSVCVVLEVKWVESFSRTNAWKFM